MFNWQFVNDKYNYKEWDIFEKEIYCWNIFKCSIRLWLSVLLGCHLLQNRIKEIVHGQWGVSCTLVTPTGLLG